MEFLTKLKDNTEFEYWNGADKDDILFIETSLEIELPEDYSTFLKECGMCNFGDTSILGIAKSSDKTSFPVIDVTQELQKEIDLNKIFFVIQYDYGEYIAVFSLSDNKIYESFLKYDKEGKLLMSELELSFDSFTDFFNDFLLLGEE